MDGMTKLQQNIENSDKIEEEDVQNIVKQTKNSKKIKFKSADYFWGFIHTIGSICQINLPRTCRFKDEKKKRFIVFIKGKKRIH